ncbi:DegT/DnrJ/EryC1/StrS aminotransferase family protein [Microvirga tunisiensis]|uniref:DegT/DnrJ/EryC1/StrS family aminotransferase n=1 Tax=Microvirga tunisiensis TaxID=2108360 RepID=UPI0030B88061
MSIPVYRPHFTGKEREYVLDCLDSGWISSRGEYIARFEDACRSFIGAEHALSVCNGTVALHLALLACGIGPGDEVIVPTLTYIASANAIRYVGATPVFVESMPDTWQVDPADVERKITSRTKAIMAVHLYGCPCDMTRLCDLAQRYHIKLIEDAAEAFGTRWHGRHVGTFGDVSTFSFFGNKTITTGEGGLVVCQDPAMSEHIGLLKSQYASPHRRYWHEDIGYNYRMTNITAAIGLAQVEKADEILAAKRRLARSYEQKLADLPISFHNEPAGATHSYWMVSFLVPSAEDREPLRDHLEKMGIETRPFFYPAHTMPMYADPRRPNSAFPVAIDLGARGLNLPSFPDLTDDEIESVAEAVRSYFEMSR